ncbi:MAG: formate--tetrahydrofolate ligase, partial [Clostridia bacterium]|nr:formate--tetrahydrofolate ligase [Clostridia bacterium]
NFFYFRFLYDLEDSVTTKIEKIVTEIYGASGVTYSKQAKLVLQNIDEIGVNKYPVCMAKTQYSFSDDSKKLGAPEDFEVLVKDINIYNGAEIITVLLNNIMTMPGLSKKPSYENIDIDENGEIVGIF